MPSATLADPFSLFPKQVETAKLIQLPSAPGLEEKVLAENVHVIIKRHTSSDSPQEYDSRDSTRRLHVKTEDLPVEVAKDPDKLLNLVFETEQGTRLKVTDTNRGDDMDMGQLRFVVVNARPWSHDSL